MARTFGKFLFLIVAGALSLLLVLYLSLLGLQAYSARQASKVLNELEALRIGDSVVDFDRAVSMMRTEYGVHVLTAGAFRFHTLWEVAAKFPDQDWLQKSFYRAGLKWWRLTTSAKAQDGKLTAISVDLTVVGCYEMLGALWTLAPDIPPPYKEFALSEDDRRTDMGWMHITSMLSGEGFRINTTAQSTQKELRARKINSKCLLSFRGCDGLCELLPDAVPVLRDRNRDWGGWTDVPTSACNTNASN